MIAQSRSSLAIWLALFALVGVVAASSGDRNPTFQHCLKGCGLTYCDPSQPPISLYLRAFGWTCEDNCKYQCAQSFTDHIRSGSRWHQFYEKWPFYRFGPIQEPFSVLMSLGNLWVNMRGIAELRRRVRPENNLRKWLEIAGWAQVNTWIWSTVFHARDTPLTERLDYFSATVTVAFSLIYAVLRVLHLQTPTTTSKLAFPAIAIVAFLVLSHFTYLLSFPLGQFPYGYHTGFVVSLGMVHNLLWVAWSLSFVLSYPVLDLGARTIKFPYPYPPNDPRKTRSGNAMTPLSLVILTLLAMSFELLDFRPLWRIVDAHSLWHLCTIPLAAGWWTFFCQDAIEMEGAMLNARINDGGLGLGINDKSSSSVVSASNSRISVSESRPLLRTPPSPNYDRSASRLSPPRRTAERSPRSPRTPMTPGKAERQD